MTHPRHINRNRSAFTLIELLVVISIIAVIAGLVVAAAGRAGRAKERNQTVAMLKKIELGLEGFKTTYGAYPATDNTSPNASAMFNPLFYELTGTTYEPDPANPHSATANRYRSLLSPAHLISVRQVTNAFGQKLVGFANSSGSNAFLTLKVDDYQQMGANDVILLVAPASPTNRAGTNKYNFWHYQAYNPAGRNPTGYDLWANLKGKKAGELEVIANWNTK
ncbi:MAG: type II secretion system protein [Limisphaerales bacterium]